MSQDRKEVITCRTKIRSMDANWSWKVHSKLPKSFPRLKTENPSMFSPTPKSPKGTKSSKEFKLISGIENTGRTSSINWSNVRDPDLKLLSLKHLGRQKEFLAMSNLAEKMKTVHSRLTRASTARNLQRFPGARYESTIPKSKVVEPMTFSPDKALATEVFTKADRSSPMGCQTTRSGACYGTSKLNGSETARHLVSRDGKTEISPMKESKYIQEAVGAFVSNFKRKRSTSGCFQYVTVTQRQPPSSLHSRSQTATKAWNDPTKESHCSVSRTTTTHTKTSSQNDIKRGKLASTSLVSLPAANTNSTNSTPKMSYSQISSTKRQEIQQYWRETSRENVKSTKMTKRSKKGE